MPKNSNICSYHSITVSVSIDSTHFAITLMCQHLNVFLVHSLVKKCAEHKYADSEETVGLIKPFHQLLSVTTVIMVITSIWSSHAILIFFYCPDYLLLFYFHPFLWNYVFKLHIRLIKTWSMFILCALHTEVVWPLWPSNTLLVQWQVKRNKR